MHCRLSALACALGAGACLAAPHIAAAQDASAPPAQTLSLTGGSFSDPQTVQIAANTGGNDLSALSASCSGAVGAAADLGLLYTPDAHPLVISLSVSGPTLLVRDPNGLWYCSAGGGGQAASVRFGHPQGGDYLIWVGGNANGAAVSISGAANQ